MEKNQILGFLGLPDIYEFDLGADGDFRPDEKVVPMPGSWTDHGKGWEDHILTAD